MIRFLMDGTVHCLEDFDPTCTVLEWLRDMAAKTGTKEGCAEGDCGACTVVIGELFGAQVRYRAVNACIYFLPMLNGKELVTVEALSQKGHLHPVQQAMAEGNGTQCGFCTPGFIMSLFARYQASNTTLPQAIDDVLAGNLCRCTGYRPIQDAAAALTPTRDVQARFGGLETVAALRSIAPDRDTDGRFADPLFEAERHWARPISETALADMLQARPGATLVAGASDVGVWVTKHHRRLDTVICLDGIDSLKKMECDADGLHVGAMVSYSDAMGCLADLHPDLGELIRRIGSVQVRNSGTIGGNIANGSPIGDMPPALIALGAELELASQTGSRRLALEDFFIDYGKQDLRAGEYLRAVHIPPLKANWLFRAYKISKRFSQDISALCGAFALDIGDGHVHAARIAYGGMAATPKRAAACEAALTRQTWDQDTVEQAAKALSEDFTPVSDMRASAEYRLTVAQNLLRKVWLESQASGRTRILQEH